MSYEQHDLFRDRLTAMPLSAARRGIAAMVLVEIVRWMPETGSLCTKTAGELSELLGLTANEMLSATGTLATLGVIEPLRQGTAALFHLKPLKTGGAGAPSDSKITEALNNHATWKRRLRHAIDTGSTDITLEDVARDDLCEFGRWLHGPDFTEAERNKAYENIVNIHAHFHQVAAISFKLALSGRKEEAERSMAVNGIFARTSLHLTRALARWRRERAQ